MPKKLAANVRLADKNAGMAKGKIYSRRSILEPSRHMGGEKMPAVLDLLAISRFLKGSRNSFFWPGSCFLNLSDRFRKRH